MVSRVSAQSRTSAEKRGGRGGEGGLEMVNVDGGDEVGERLGWCWGEGGGL